MEYMRNAVQEGLEIRILYTTLEKPKPTPSGIDGQVRFLDLPRVIVRKTIETRDLRALVQKRRREM